MGELLKQTNAAANGNPPQPVKPFGDVEQWRKQIKAEVERLGYTRHNLGEETPNTHLSSLFRLTPQIRAHGVTPTESMYFLDFVDNGGARIEERTGLVVYDGVQGGPMYRKMLRLGINYGADPKLELYVLHSARAYEIRSASDDKLLKTISFSPVVERILCE